MVISGRRRCATGLMSSRPRVSRGCRGKRWNYGPFLPSAVLIERLEDRLRILPALPDQSGHRGLSLSDVHNGVVTLYREGVELGEAPFLSPDNHALAGQPLVLPIEVSGGSVVSLPVDVSYDAGATWRPVRVQTARAGWFTQITPPVGAEDISLRASVTDASGNTAMQSMTRAIPLD